ncbi:hypothetical protein RB202_08190 [Micrococcus yunnanensis]|uniref:hypothetical protein n=1 Tax=Micrococcus TaxID=1269 RepID=UPI003014AD7F
MNTQQQTRTAPAGFAHRRMEDGTIPGAYFDTWDGPTVGGVSSYYAPDQGIILAVDGYGDEADKCRRLGFDVTPDQARVLAADLAAAVETLDMLPTPEVERIARSLFYPGVDAAVDDMVQESVDAGVNASAVVAAYSALIQQRDA